MSKIPCPPTTINWPPLGSRWFRWSEIEACFWPGRGCRSSAVDPELAEIKDGGGVYLLAWAKAEPARKKPHCAPEVRYVGETNWFNRRLANFGNSAGFWGPRANGHSAGWSWPEGKKDRLWVAFFDVFRGLDLEAHLWHALRVWVEGVAVEEQRVANSRLPVVNGVKRNQVLTF